MIKITAIQLNIDKSYFNEAYLPVLNSTEREIALYGGGGSGKSHFGVQYMIMKALKYENRKVLVVRKVQNTLRESTYALIKDVLSDMKVLGYSKYTTSHMNIKLPNGSQFIFTGLDDSEKIKSITGVDDILIEEATELSEDDYTQLSLRLRSSAPNQQIVSMFNPISKRNWVYNYFFKNPGENVQVLHTTYKDNRFLPQDYIDTLEGYKETNPLYYSIYALGEFGSLGKQVFDNWEVKDFEVNDLVKSKYLETAIGLDFGFTADPTTIISSVVDMNEKVIYVFDEVYQKGLLNNEIADIIFSKGMEKQRIIADSAEPKSIEEIKDLGVWSIEGVKKGPGSINQGIQYLKQFDIIVHPSAKNLIGELEEYSYKKDPKTGEYLNELVGPDHCIDALRYSMTRLNKKKKLRTMSKSVFGL